MSKAKSKKIEDETWTKRKCGTEQYYSGIVYSALVDSINAAAIVEAVHIKFSRDIRTPLYNIRTEVSL